MLKLNDNSHPQVIVQGLDSPKSIGVDSTGNVYVTNSGTADGGRTRPHIGKYDKDGKWIMDIYVNDFPDDIIDMALGWGDIIYVLRKDGVWKWQIPPEVDNKQGSTKG